MKDLRSAAKRWRRLWRRHAPTILLLPVLFALAFAAAALRPAPQGTFDSAALARRALPAMVTIYTVVPDHRPRPEKEMAGPVSATRSSYGSGFYFDRSGLIATCAHVVDGVTSIRVRRSDGTVVPATLVGLDRLSDVAVLRTAGPAPATLQFGSAKTHAPGDPVLAIGSPLDFEGSVSRGIVSALDRAMRAGAPHWLVQHDAVINPGNSGGALIDADGKVIGLNNAVPDGQWSYAGMSFAVESDIAWPVIRELAAKGQIARATLGTEVRALDPVLANGLDLTENSGVVVQNPVPDGAAARAGLKPGDVIVAFDGRPIHTASDLVEALAGARANDRAELTLLRGSARLTRNIRFDAAPRGATLPAHHTLPAKPAPRSQGLTLAASGQSVTARVAEGSRAAQSGLRSGDVILAVGRTPVRDCRTARRLIAEAAATPALLIRRSTEGTFYVILGRPEAVQPGSNVVARGDVYL